MIASLDHLHVLAKARPVHMTKYRIAHTGALHRKLLKRGEFNMVTPARNTFRYMRKGHNFSSLPPLPSLHYLPYLSCLL